MASLQAVTQWMVTAENSPRQVDGLDALRCIALHNTVLEYAWIKSGRLLAHFRDQSKTWWQYYEGQIEELEDRFHPSVRTFLEGALVLPWELGDERKNFFYTLEGLHSPEIMFQHIEEENLLTLYAGHEKFASSPDGLVHDQNTHLAAMHWDVEDAFDITLTGQKLECYLTVYIEMILRHKVVALDNAVDRDPILQRAEDGGFRMVPTGPADLSDCLRVWKMLVESIESKMGLATHEVERALYSERACEAAGISDGFAKQFLTKAQKPRFRFIAPGLRLLDEVELIAQPFQEAHQHESLAASQQEQIMPILLSRGEDMSSTSHLSFGWPYSDVGSHKAMVSECPVGLYLDPCVKTTGLPFEDACRLILPFGFTGTWARRSDNTPAQKYDDLLQSGNNAYIQEHGTQLQAVLENAYGNVERGHWEVDQDGVSGGINVWKDADTEARWRSYWVPVGPGRYW